MLVDLKNVRLAFPQLFEARTVNGEGEPAYSATFIFGKDTEAYKAIEAAIAVVAKEKWADKATNVLKDLRAKDRTAIHDGDLKSEYSGYEGNFYVTSRTKKRPVVVDRDRTTLTSVDGRPYGGCYVNAKVDIWAMDNQFGKRICATLAAVQFAKNGEPFSGGAAVSADDFDEVESDED